MGNNWWECKQLKNPQDMHTLDNNFPTVVATFNKSYEEKLECTTQ